MKTNDLIILHPSNSKEIEILKAFAKALNIHFEISKEKNYNKDFVEKIRRSKKQQLQGEDVVINSDDLWK